MRVRHRPGPSRLLPGALSGYPAVPRTGGIEWRTCGPIDALRRDELAFDQEGAGCLSDGRAMVPLYVHPVLNLRLVVHKLRRSLMVLALQLAVEPIGREHETHQEHGG